MIGTLIPIYVFAVGVVFYAGMLLQRVNEHDRRLDKLEERLSVLPQIERNVEKILDAFNNGDPA